jgi:hypothetical protein
VLCSACDHSQRRDPTPPLLTQVPDVVGLSTDRAFDRLSAAGLCEGTTYVLIDPSGGGQRVVHQRPAAGTRVRIGAAVTLIVVQRHSAWAGRGSVECGGIRGSTSLLAH